MNQDEARCKALRSISQWASGICTVDDMEADVDAYAQARVDAAVCNVVLAAVSKYTACWTDAGREQAFVEIERLLGPEKTHSS